MTDHSHAEPTVVDPEIKKGLTNAIERHNREIVRLMRAAEAADAARLLQDGPWSHSRVSLAMKDATITVSDGCTNVTVHEPELVQLVRGIVQRHLIGLARCP